MYPFHRQLVKAREPIKVIYPSNPMTPLLTINLDDGAGLIDDTVISLGGADVHTTVGHLGNGNYQRVSDLARIHIEGLVQLSPLDPGLG